MNVNDEGMKDQRIKSFLEELEEEEEDPEKWRMDEMKQRKKGGSLIGWKILKRPRLNEEEGQGLVNQNRKAGGAFSGF